MAQLLFVSCLFLLFHSTVERNRTGGLVTELQSLFYLAMDGGRCKAGFRCTLSHRFVLGLKVDELLEVFGFSDGILLAKVIGLMTYDRKVVKVDEAALRDINLQVRSAL